MSELLCLDWSEFASNISETLKDIRNNGDLSDVTLVCDDGEINAHKLILYSGSTFFQSILTKVNPIHEHPLIYIKGVKINHLEAILDFMYKGEINIAQDDLKYLLETAADLKVKGLSMKETEPKEKHFKREDTVKEPPPSVMDFIENYESDIAIIEDAEKNSYEEMVKYEPELIQGDEHFEQHINLNDNLEEKALDLMARVDGPNNRVTWFCKVCKKNSSDKTRIRKHVIAKHLKQKARKDDNDFKLEEKYMVSFQEDDVTISSHEEFQAKVFSLMEKVDGPNNRVTWFCKECQKNNSDKTRIRKHVEIHIPGLVFSCLYCDAKRKCSGNMDVHMSKSHSNMADPLSLV